MLPVPATAGLHLAAEKPAVTYGSAYAIGVRDAIPAARGGAEFVGRIEHAGGKVLPTSNPEHFRVDFPGGTPSAGVRELVEAEHRIVAAYVNGTDIYCEIGSHKKPASAVGTVYGGAVACAECLDGGAA
jgi:hypothetical protein